TEGIDGAGGRSGAGDCAGKAVSVTPPRERSEFDMQGLETWLANGVLISDGAWGTQLQARGLPAGTNPDTWNLTHPEQVEAVARAYVEAGSQVILTNSFRANAIAMHGNSAADLDAINCAAVAISKQAAGTRALVFASIGP